MSEQFEQNIPIDSKAGSLLSPEIEQKTEIWGRVTDPKKTQSQKIPILSSRF